MNFMSDPHSPTIKKFTRALVRQLYPKLKNHQKDSGCVTNKNVIYHNNNENNRILGWIWMGANQFWIGHSIQHLLAIA